MKTDLIDFSLHQQQKFDDLAEALVQNPAELLSFDSVSDVYKAPWLERLPGRAVWSVSGQDDGAEQFCLIMRLGQQYIYVGIDHEWLIKTCNRHGTVTEHRLIRPMEE